MISIITPAYNAEKYLGATIEGVIRQSFRDWEYVIVDDGSKDSTFAIASKYAAQDPRIWAIHQKNAGVSAARNRGLSEASLASDYVIFLDGDDVWEPTALETLIGKLAAHPESSAAYGLARYIDSDGAVVDAGVLEAHQRERYGFEDGRVIAWPLERPTTFAVEAVAEAIITCGTVLTRRAALKKAGAWDESLKFWEDWDLWLRLSRVADIQFVDKVVLNYRIHASNASRDSVMLESGERQVRRKLLDSLKTTPELLAIATSGAEFYQRRVIERRMKWLKQSLQKGDPIGAVKQLRHALRCALQGPVKLRS